MSNQINSLKVLCMEVIAKKPEKVENKNLSPEISYQLQEYLLKNESLNDETLKILVSADQKSLEIPFNNNILSNINQDSISRSINV